MTPDNSPTAEGLDLDRLDALQVDLLGLLEQGAEIAERMFALEPLALFAAGAVAMACGARLLVIVAAAGAAYHVALAQEFLADPIPWATAAFVALALLGAAHGVLSLAFGNDGGTQAFLLLLTGTIVLIILKPLGFLRVLDPRNLVRSRQGRPR